MTDSRTGRTQSPKLNTKYYAQDLHKSMFINDLMISLPSYYTLSWPEEVVNSHHRGTAWDDIEIKYDPPRSSDRPETQKFSGKIHLGNSKGRGQFSSYRLKWSKDFSVQLAKDYPKSFVRALEFHLGDDKYKELGYTEFDIGGFKEQVQIKVDWNTNSDGFFVPKVSVKELFQVREDAQFFPNVYKELSSFLIAEHLLGDGEARKRRLLVSSWRKREDLPDELKENVLYVLANRDKANFYVGQTKESLARRYPAGEKHHSWDDWEEYCVIQLPEGTTNPERILMERALIEASSMLFNSSIASSNPLFGTSEITLMNKSR